MPPTTSIPVLPPPEPSTGALEATAASLAFELAMGLQNWRQILPRYGLFEADLHRLMANPAFIKLLKEAQSTWESAKNVAERTRLKAQFVLETALMPMANIIHDSKATSQSKIDATKLISAIAGMSRSEAAGGTGTGFVLNINLGEKSVSLEPTGPLLDQSNG